MKSGEWIFDTSILLLFFYKEPGYKDIRRLLDAASHKKAKISASDISFMEVQYKLIRILGEKQAVQSITTITELPVTFIPIDKQVLSIAARFKARGKISLADSIIAATAYQVKTPLLTKDPEFLALKDEVQVELL